MREVFKPTPEIALLFTLPGVGSILAVVIALEVGDVTRFASSEKFAAYAGTTPRVHASGGRIRFGPLRPASTATSSGRSWKRPPRFQRCFLRSESAPFRGPCFSPVSFLGTKHAVT